MESTTFTPATITFKSLAEIASKRVLVTQPGINYMLKVLNATSYVRPDGQTVAILNFNAMTNYHQAQFNEAIKANDIELAQKQVVTASPRIGKDFVPSKGELVNVVFDWIPVKGSDEVALRPVSVSPLAQAAKVNVSIDFAALAEAGL